MMTKITEPVFIAARYLLLIVVSSALLTSIVQAKESEPNWNRSVLPVPQPEFKGKAGLRVSESVRDFPAEISAPKGAPNILLIMPDDVGFGATAPFGGPVKADLDL
jgi:arylsulfatase